MTKAKKTILSIDNVGVAENQITVEYNGETEIYNLPR